MTPQITAGMVAAELRRLADALDKEPDAVIPRVSVGFNCKYSDNGKEMFLNLARIMPRPLAKDDYTALDAKRLRHETGAAMVEAWVEKSKVCNLIEPARPAVYECIPLLSADEEAELEAAS